MPAPSARVPGVQYVTGDLARGLGADAFEGVDSIVHCAAETSGGKSDQQRNSIAATKLLIERGAAAGVKTLLHVSSLAVIKPGNGRVVDESTPVDAGNLERGPYVWGKAESEVLAQQLGRDLGIQLKIVRPGPLVDFDDFHAPGRLGREVGPWYVAIGGRQHAAQRARRRHRRARDPVIPRRLRGGAGSRQPGRRRRRRHAASWSSGCVRCGPT